ncbi:MAG TPA: penicillin-binding protein activator [Caulobacterales bacterium]|nr:penicillin-binding protein activator [Caulobacterales bacterium]
MSVKRSSSDARGAPSLSRAKAAALFGLAAAGLSACATTPSAPVAGPTGPAPPPQTVVQTREGVTPPFMAGRPIVRVGLLLPFSLRPQDASALYSAAELALFDHGDRNTLLIPRDAGADQASAQAAAHALITDGADIIIGPVLADGVQGAGREAHAANIPVIGFSSDRTVAGQGVYLLSFQLEDEVSRIVSYAAAHNIRSIALLGPDNEYGRRVESSLREAAAANGVAVTASQLYNRTDAEAAAAATQLGRSFGPTPPQAILIAESGSALRAIGPALVAGGVDLGRVRLLGTSAWAGGDAEREPTLAGGWYVSPDPSARTDFESRYQSVFQRQPTRLASLAYDAVALASALSHDRGAQGFSRSQLENPEGFLGSDGIFRFRANGTIERGLAIMEVRAGASAPVDPAPRRFPRSGT